MRGNSLRDQGVHDYKQLHSQIVCRMHVTSATTGESGAQAEEHVKKELGDP